MNLGNYRIRKLTGFDPTFSTYNLCQHYTLNLSLTVQCAGKKFSAKFPPHPILALPVAYKYKLNDWFMLLGSHKIRLREKELKNDGGDVPLSLEGLCGAVVARLGQECFHSPR
jgi:hypothetical protein